MSLPSAPGAPIFLIGFMGSGKTTVGGLLAERLGWAFVDLDDLIEPSSRADVSRRSSPARGRRGFGGARPRRPRGGGAGPRSVVATGGGAACREENLAAHAGVPGACRRARVSAAEALRRTGKRSGRPLLDGEADPLAAATSLLLEARQPFYARAHLRIETDGQTPPRRSWRRFSLVSAGRRIGKTPGRATMSA